MGSKHKGSWALLALLALAAALGLLASGCGGEEQEQAGVEGDFVRADDALYQVQLSRLLNPEQRPDDTLLRGQPQAPPGQEYLAVFLTIDNEGSDSYLPPRDMKVIDTVGNEYLPLDSTQSGFGLDFGERIPPGERAPPADSPAAEGSTAGAMVLFRVKAESANDNLPLRIQIPTAGKAESDIELDI